MKKKIVVMGLMFSLIISSIFGCGSDSEKLESQSKIVDGVDTRERAIITTDLECDDMSSLVHLSLFFNEVDVDGIVYSSSQFHFVGDGGETTLGEVTPNYLCAGDGVDDPGTLTEYRPMELGWIESLWENEYAQAYENLSKNAPDYPTPEYLLSITKVGNVEFEGDVREDTEGSDLIKEAILDDDERTLYLYGWGGFNTIARALLSIADEYQNTAEWEEVYNKIVEKVIICGTWQDTTYVDYIVDLYPDLKEMSASDGYAGYMTAIRGQADSLYTFNSEWLTENIKFDHGPLNEKYNLMGDGTYYEGEPEDFQFGQKLTIDWGKLYTFDQYDFLGEGDTGGFIPLIDVGLRGLESGEYGTWAGKISYTWNGNTTTYGQTMSTDEATEYKDYNFVTGKESYSTKRYILAFQEEWAARADWCVSGYSKCNHAPIVSVEAKDLEAKAGTSVNINGTVEDPDGDSYTAYWWIDEYTYSYSGESKNLQVWNPVSLSTSFTVPSDAQVGDRFCITLEVRDDSDAPMTRYAQIIVTVTE